MCKQKHDHKKVLKSMYLKENVTLIYALKFKSYPSHTAFNALCDGSNHKYKSNQ